MTERILVVGARGFVGAAVANGLAEMGCEVHAFGPRMADGGRRLRQGISETVGSITVADEINVAIAEFEPTAIISLAAHGEAGVGLTRSGDLAPESAHAVNVGGFRVLLEAARHARVPRVLWASSTTVYAPATFYPQAAAGDRVDEDAPCRPRTFYGLTKRMAESLAQYYIDRYAMPVVGLRLPLVFGPGLWYDGAAAHLRRLFAAAVRGEDIVVEGPDVRADMIYVKDVAGAFSALLASQQRLGPVYNLAGFTTNLPEIAGELARRRPGARYTVLPVVPPIVYPLVDEGRFVRDTGFALAFPMERAIEDYLSELSQETQ